MVVAGVGGRLPWVASGVAIADCLPVRGQFPRRADDAEALLDEVGSAMVKLPVRTLELGSPSEARPRNQPGLTAAAASSLVDA